MKNALLILRSIQRPLLAAVLVVGVLGTVQAYMQFVASVPFTTYDTAERAAEGVFAVELTLTFDVEDDGFLLNEGEPVVVDFRGRNLMQGQGPFQAGVPVIVSPVEGIAESRDGQGGKNSFAVRILPKQSPQDSFSLEAPNAAQQLSHVLRLRVLRDGIPLAEKSLWSDPGQPVQGVLTLTVDPPPTTTHH